MADRKVREARILIRLDDRVKQDLEAMADRLGIAPGTLAAVVIGQYLDQQREATRVRDLLVADTKTGLLDLLSQFQVAEISSDI